MKKAIALYNLSMERKHNTKVQCQDCLAIFDFRDRVRQRQALGIEKYLCPSCYRPSTIKSVICK
jgi:hypothetical protein